MCYFVFRDHWFFFPNIFCWFLFAVNCDEDIVSESLSVKIILHSSFLWSFFSMWSSVFFVFFSLNPILPILHELLDHHSNRLVRIVKSVKKILYKLHWVTYLCEMWSEEFISSAFNWSVNKFSDELWRGSPSPLNFVNYLFLCLWKN